MLAGVRSAALHRRHIIFGSNTDVGKTVVTAGLVRACLYGSANKDNSEQVNGVQYIKPLQCGGSDEEFVARHSQTVLNSTLNVLEGRTLFNWSTPASPHVASRKENHPASDEEIASSLQSALKDISEYDIPTTTWIETAGGALSPASASPLNRSPQHAYGEKQRNNADESNIEWGWSTQADLYRQFVDLTSVVLVGDGKLGGISATLTSLESLMVRGYDVSGIILIEPTATIGSESYGNVDALQEYINRQFRFRPGSSTERQHSEIALASLPSLPPNPEPLIEWFEKSHVKETFQSFNDSLEVSWKLRSQKEDRRTKSDGTSVSWWPFKETTYYSDP